MGRISSGWLTSCRCKSLGLQLKYVDGSNIVKGFTVLDFCQCKHGQNLRQYYPNFRRLYDPHIFWSEELNTTMIVINNKKMRLNQLLDYSQQNVI